MPRASVLCAALLAILTPGAAPAAAGDRDAAAARPDPHVEALGRMMAGLRAESVRHARRIRRAYAPQVRRLALADRSALGRALDAGRVAPLVPLAAHYGVRPRLTGAHPIGEKDLGHQPLYVAARPEAIGCLLHVASRVRSGDVEVTSLVRHRRYQRALARGNPNARTAVPTHAMGLAFDISVLNVPAGTAREIRDVLRRMAADGDLFFIAERRQLVFHVVPTPQRRAFYAALARSLGDAEPLTLPPLPWLSPAPDAHLPRLLAPAEPAAAGVPGGWPLVVLAIAGAAARLLVRR